MESSAYILKISITILISVVMLQNISVNIVKIVNKRPSLVNLPVRVNIWIRPECQRMQFEVLKKAAPSIMFLQSDGGRNEKEWNAIYKNRYIFDTEVDWNCTIYKIYADKNNGLYTMGKKVSDIIWKEVERCLFLEDDQIPSVSCFFFHEELLERYKTSNPQLCA